jgi:hypothetical protein
VVVGKTFNITTYIEVVLAFLFKVLGGRSDHEASQASNKIKTVPQTVPRKQKSLTNVVFARLLFFK